MDNNAQPIQSEGRQSMKLELYEEDLKDEHKDVPTGAVQYAHLTATAQAAVLVIGRGTFYRHRGTDHENYNLIYAPKKK